MIEHTTGTMIHTMFVARYTLYNAPHRFQAGSTPYNAASMTD